MAVTEYTIRQLCDLLQDRRGDEVSMAYSDVCRPGNPAGGRVREDDVARGEPPERHNAGGPSPGLLRFIAEVVQVTPTPNMPPRPIGFPANPKIDHYPGRSAADAHYEGRAADIFFNSRDPTAAIHGNWLFDWCVQNCTVYGIQGVIFDNRQWFSEANGGAVRPRPQGDHSDHVHVELNCEGANLRIAGGRGASGS